MPDYSLEIENLSIGYRRKGEDRVVASGLSSPIMAGSLTCLLGANGIGKSTLLRTLAGFQPKLSGQIRLSGRGIEQYSTRMLARQISVVLTERVSIRNLTARGLVSFGRSPYTDYWGHLSPEDHARVDRAISVLGIDHLADRHVDRLSDGEKQKVLIAKALAQDTPIILLDEPTAFLDFPSKVEIMHTLHALCQSMAKTIFLSTHDLELALQIADTIWLMDQNARLHIGAPEDLALRGTLSTFFQRKGIIFDAQSGLFRVESQCSHSIGLQGHGLHYSMLCKALLRQGIRAERDALTDYYIRVEPPHFLLYHGSELLSQHSSVQGVLNALKPLPLQPVLP